MVTVYKLINKKLLIDHIDSIYELIKKSEHKHKFDLNSKENLQEQLTGLVERDGFVLKATYGQAAAGLMIVEVRNTGEFGVLEYLIDEEAEERTIDLLFEQCTRELNRRKFSAVYCDSDWFASVANKKIQNKFLMSK